MESTLPVEKSQVSISVPLVTVHVLVLEDKVALEYSDRHGIELLFDTQSHDKGDDVFVSLKTDMTEDPLSNPAWAALSRDLMSGVCVDRRILIDTSLKSRFAIS